MFYKRGAILIEHIIGHFTLFYSKLTTLEILFVVSLLFFLFFIFSCYFSHEERSLETSYMVVDQSPKILPPKINKSSHQRCAIKKVFLKISQNSQENTWCFPVNVVKFLRTSFFTEHVRMTASKLMIIVAILKIHPQNLINCTVS